MFKQIYSENVDRKVYRDLLIEENKAKGIDREPTEAEVQDLINEDLGWEYEAVMQRLEVLTSGTIIALGDIMTLEGRYNAYRLMGNCVNQVLYTKDNKELTVYYDGKDVRAEDVVDGGINYYLYRELKNDEQSFPFLKKIYNQEHITQNEVEQYTNSLDTYIKQIYAL